VLSEIAREFFDTHNGWGSGKWSKELSGIHSYVYIMNLAEAVDEALAEYDMSRSEEAEKMGRIVATLQD
jgi:hypothetical protein